MSRLMMPACENFVENVWRKGKCSNCFQSLTSHRLSDERTRTRSDKSLVDTGADSIANGQEYQAKARVTRSNGLALKERACVDRSLNRGKLTTRTKNTVLSTQKCALPKSDSGERTVKPTISPKPKPVPKPRQRTSSTLLICDPSVELCSQQTSLNVDSERLTEYFPGDSKEISHPDERNFNTSERKTERDPKLPSSTKTERNGKTQTAEAKSASIILNKEQRICTLSSSETNDLEISAQSDSSRIGEAQYEEGEEEYVPMKDNIFDMNMIMDNCGADVLDPDRNRSDSETSIVSADSVFDSGGDDSKGTHAERSGDIDRTSFTPNLQKQVKRSNDNGEVTKNYGKLSTNPKAAKHISDNDSCSDTHENGPNLCPEVIQANTQILPILSLDAAKSVAESSDSCSSTWDGCSDVWENGTEGLEAESLLSRSQKGLRVLKIKSSAHDPFGSKALKRLSNPDIKGQIPEGPVYVNSSVKPSPKPYKVVDISTGMLVKEEHNQTPPLPPKSKDLVLDGVPHEYMDPTDGPYKRLPIGGSPINVPSSSDAPVARGLSETTNLTRHSVCAPMPRSHSSSQCGTFPRAVPRASKVFDEEKTRTENGKENIQTDDTTNHVPHNISTPTETPTSEMIQAAPALPLPPPEVASDSTTQASASQNASGSLGDATKMVYKPNRSAPSRPTHSPPLVSSHRQSVISLPSNTYPSVQNQTNATKEIAPAATKASSPKSAIKKAFTSMKRIGSKKRSKRRTLEISGPILVNEEIPSFVAQQEFVRQRALSEGNVLQVIRKKSTQEKLQIAVTNRESSSMDKQSEQTMSPPLPARRRQGYENYPFSQAGETIERPQKPPRKTRAVNPLMRDASVQLTSTKENQTEEPAYLQPCEDGLTFKVEAALANLNDAAVLAEALSRVEQEKLGPLPAIPKSRHVRFQFESGDTSPATTGSTPALITRPVSAVLPTLLYRDAGSNGDPPELPSRPPNTKLSKSNRCGRSHSVKEVRNSDSYAVKVGRTQSLSTHANILERRYNKILKLQMQTLEEVVESRKASLLPASGLDWSNTQWRDYEVLSPALTVELQGAVLLPVKCCKIPGGHKLLAKVHTQHALSRDAQVTQEQPTLRNDLQFCESLPHHVNTARVLTHFNSNVGGDIIKRYDGGACEATIAISDQVPVETVAQFVERTVAEHESSPEGYERKVCLLLLQILSGLAHLARERVIHRDLTLENLLLLEQEHVVISNFASAYRESNNCNDSDFARNMKFSPPEIVNAANTATPLDYKKCDCFAVGCMIYKLLHRKNPFAANIALVRQEYSIADLPSMSKKSRYSQGLGTLACHLLHRDPATRMSATEGLQLLQVLLWIPDILEGECLKNAAGDWLETERAHMVAKMARSQMHCDPSKKGYLETLLKCQFLFDATVESLVKCYTLLRNV